MATRSERAAARQRAHQADSLEYTIAESGFGAALLGEVRFGSKAARAQQAPEERQVAEYAEIGASDPTLSIPIGANIFVPTVSLGMRVLMVNEGSKSRNECLFS